MVLSFFGERSGGANDLQMVFWPLAEKSSFCFDALHRLCFRTGIAVPMILRRGGYLSNLSNPSNLSNSSNLFSLFCLLHDADVWGLAEHADKL